MAATVTLREHLLSAGWPEATVDHVLELYGEGTLGEADAADLARKAYGRTDFREQVAVWKGEIPAAAVEKSVAPEHPETLKSGAFLMVHQCYSCGGMHEHVPITPYRKDNAPWTHWFTCPTNGDPVPLSIVMRDSHPIEVCRRVMADLETALSHGTLMSAIFYVGRDGKLQLRWMTDKFPHSQFEEAGRLLAEHNAKNGGIAKPVDPLPRAQPRKSQSFQLPPELFKPVAPGPGNGELPIVAEAATTVDDDDEADEGDH